MKNKFIQKISLGAALLLLTSNTTFAQAPEQSYTCLLYTSDAADE